MEAAKVIAERIAMANPRWKSRPKRQAIAKSG